MSDRPAAAPEATPSKPVWRARQGPKSKPRSKSSNAINYLGVDNLMRSYHVTQKRTWRSADGTTGHDGRGDVERGRGSQMSDDQSWTETSPGEMRRSRKSSFTRYTYPAKFHRSPVPGSRQSTEELIPLCLRQYPQYSRQPVRQSCAYGPPSSVTFSALHVVRSLNLPHSRTRELHGNRASATFKAQPSARLAGSASASVAACHETGSASDGAGSDDADEKDRNGVYHCVYPGRDTDVTIVVDAPAADSNYEGDFEEDEEEDGEDEEDGDDEEDNDNSESDCQDSPRGSGTTPADSSRESRHSEGDPDSPRRGRSRSRSPETLPDSDSDRSVDELVQQYKRQVQLTQNDISSASEVDD